MNYCSHLCPMSHPSSISFSPNALTTHDELCGVESCLPWQLASGAFLLIHRLLLFNTCILCFPLSLSVWVCVSLENHGEDHHGHGQTLVNLHNAVIQAVTYHWGHPSSLLLGYAIKNPAFSCSAPVFKYNLLKEQAGSIVMCRKPTRPGRSRELSEIDSTKEVHRR